jgi:hypothetical protein
MLVFLIIFLKKSNKKGINMSLAISFDSRINQVNQPLEERRSGTVGSTVVTGVKVAAKTGQIATDMWLKKAIAVQAAENAARYALHTTGQMMIRKPSEAAIKILNVSNVLKKIPFISLGIGSFYAVYRFTKGQYVKALGEVASAVLSCYPVYGTAAAVTLDATMAIHDIHQANK